MASTVHGPFERLKVIGPISVQRVERTTTPSWRIMLMGLTGTGKSTFIESFADDRSTCEKISGYTLESVTQKISSYKLVNVVDKQDPNRLVYLVDTPGFEDTKISEREIIKMAQDWLLAENLLGVNRIMYFAPVHETRFSGSKRRTLELFKAVAGEKSAEVVVFVTTMWDILVDRTKPRAEERAQELQNSHWKNYIKKGSRVFKFTNEQHSSLAILDQVCNIRVSGLKWFEFEEMMRQRKDIKNTIFGKYIYFALLDRKGAIGMSLLRIAEDLQDASLFDLGKAPLRLERIKFNASLWEVEKEIKEYGQVNPEWEKEWKESRGFGNSENQQL